MPRGEDIDKEESHLGMYTGFVLAKRLKADDRYKHLPILLFTILNDQTLTSWAEEAEVPMLKKQYTYPWELLGAIESMGIAKDSSPDK